jgi:predicted nucleic acid-binding protein
VTTPIERWILDTNVWVFGLRCDQGFPDCALLLDQIGAFYLVIPLQVLKELHLNLTEDEMRVFYQLINQCSEFAEQSWDSAPAERVGFYQQRGCRKGDAVIAAHAEALAVDYIVTENRQFLQTIVDLPVKILTPADARSRLS